MSADDVGADDAALRAAAQARLAKHGVTLDEDNVQLVIRHIADYPEIVAAALAAVPRPVTQPECACPPCPGRGNDGHRMTHCAECCFGTGVEADEDCPKHGRAAFATPSQPAHGEALTESERDARMAAVSEAAVAAAESVWTEDEPTLAEYELSQAILAATPAAGTARLTDVEHEALLIAWPWPEEAATTKNGFGEVVATVERILARRRLAAQPAHGDNEAALQIAREDCEATRERAEFLFRENVRLTQDLADLKAQRRAALSASAEPEGGEGRG